MNTLLRTACSLIVTSAPVLLGSPLRGQEKVAPPPAAGAVRDISRTYRTARFTLDGPNVASSMLFSPEVVADKDGSVHLAHSVLLADETGATDYRQTEALSERVRAKKIFSLADGDTDTDDAELFFFGTAREVRFNGHPLKPEPLVSTGWTRARAHPSFLKKGDNEIVFSGGGSLLIEPGRPGRSFRSNDGGQTWSDRALGRDNLTAGEYLVRLRLARYPQKGWAMSPVFDLWASEGDVARPWKIDSFSAPGELNRDQPAGTRVTAWLRTGTTPSPDEEHWTAWRKLDREVTTDAETSRHRWAQLRYDLTTRHAHATPRLCEVAFTCAGVPAEKGTHRLGAFKLHEPAAGEWQPGSVNSVPFVYQRPSPRLKLLREKYQLDKVIAPGKTEMEQLMLLRYWVRNQCHRGWASHPALWIPPWDALLILEARDRPDCLVMCTHFSCVFTQCCLALGWNARHCILDHHCVSEVWVDQHHKWVMMDTGNSAERADVGLHFERGGVPLSARELHLIQRDGKTDGVRVCFTPARLMEKIAPLCRPAPPPKGGPAKRPDTVPLAGLKDYPVCRLDSYRRYAFPPRNNFLTTLYPGELEQGFSEYFYDGYYWVGDSADKPRLSPEYSLHLPPQRAGDIDWDLNWVGLHLGETPNPGEVQVDVESHVPNLTRLEKDTTGAAWQTTPARFVWKLKPGRNLLSVRGVNHWGRAGRPRRVELEWTPAR